MNKATEGKHLSKLRFNAVDVLIVALLVCAALVWAVTYFFESNIQNRFTLVLQLPSASTEQVAQSDFQAKKDTKVYDPETGKQLGVLLEDYDRAAGRDTVWSAACDLTRRRCLLAEGNPGRTAFREIPFPVERGDSRP